MKSEREKKIADIDSRIKMAEEKFNFETTRAVEEYRKNGYSLKYNRIIHDAVDEYKTVVRSLLILRASYLYEIRE